MRALVTGSAGQVARSLVERAALHPDLEMIALGRPTLDLEQEGSAARAISEAAPDLVINAAAYTAVDQAEDEPDRAFRINRDGAGEVAAAAARLAIPVIHLSTDYVFDGRAEGAYAEQSPVAPVSVYGRSKMAGEELVRRSNARHLIVRTAWVYSPFGRNFVRTMMTAAQTRASLTVVDDQVGSPSYALDLADGLIRVIDVWRESPQAGTGETYHLAGSGVVSWYGFAAAIMEQCRGRGLPTAEVRPIRTEDWPTKAARPRNSVLDCAKFARDFDFVMPHWSKSVNALVARLAEQ